MSNTFDHITVKDSLDSSPMVGWGMSRFVYTKDQLIWIARMLKLNGDSITKVFECLLESSLFNTSTDCSIADGPARNVVSHLWMVERVQQACLGKASASVPEDWSDEILKAYHES